MRHENSFYLFQVQLGKITYKYKKNTDCEVLKYCIKWNSSSPSSRILTNLCCRREIDGIKERSLVFIEYSLSMWSESWKLCK